MKAKKLNIGCGKLHFNSSEKSEWINIDIEPLKKPDMLIDCTKGLPFEDESVEEIYAGHFFEHLTFNDMIKVIKDCNRVLKKGCYMVITIPDMLKTYKYYQEGVFQRKMIDLVAYGDEPNPANNHKQILDEEYIIKVLNDYFETVQSIQFTHHMGYVTKANTHIKCIK